MISGACAGISVSAVEPPAKPSTVTKTSSAAIIHAVRLASRGVAETRTAQANNAKPTGMRCAMIAHGKAPLPCPVLMPMTAPSIAACTMMSPRMRLTDQRVRTRSLRSNIGMAAPAATRTAPANPSAEMTCGRTRTAHSAETSAIVNPSFAAEVLGPALPEEPTAGPTASASDARSRLKSSAVNVYCPKLLWRSLVQLTGLYPISGQHMRN